MEMFWPLHSNSIKNLSRSVWEENREKNKAQTSSRTEAGLGGEFEILLGFADGQTQTGNDRRPPAAASALASCMWPIAFALPGLRLQPAPLQVPEEEEEDDD